MAKQRPSDVLKQQDINLTRAVQAIVAQLRERYGLDNADLKIAARSLDDFANGMAVELAGGPANGSVEAETPHAKAIAKTIVNRSEA